MTDKCATIATLRAEMDKLSNRIAVANKAAMAKALHDRKLRRIKCYIDDFLDEEPGYRRAHRRYVRVPIYREACGIPKMNQFEVRIDEDGNEETTITFYVSTQKLQDYIDRWWTDTFRDNLCVGIEEI